MAIEQSNGVHSKEMTQVERKKSTADMFAEHCKLDYGMCANDKVIDANKRGKVKDITETGQFQLNDTVFTE